MNLLRSFVNNKLIDYLNYSDAYMETDSGIYKISAKKASNDDLDFNEIELVLNSIKQKPFASVFEYNENLSSMCNAFLRFGLELSVMVDVKSCDLLDEYVNSGIDDTNIHLITPKLLKYNKFKFENAQVKISDLKLQDVNQEMCCNAIETLFFNDTYEKKVSLDINDVYSGSIVIDNNNVVLDGRFKVLMIKFLYDETEMINCTRLLGVYSMHSSPNVNVNEVLNSFRLSSPRLAKFIANRYNHSVNDNDKKLLSNITSDLCKTHIKNWLESL